MAYTHYKPKLKATEVKAIQDYEERGLALIEKHRKDIINVANKPVSWFFNHKFKEHSHKHKDGQYIFVPCANETKVLAVAHLDTVVCPRLKGFSWNTAQDEYGLSQVKMTTVDDRLGLAMIMFVFPELGLDMDWLFTEGEEDNRSTAQGWTPPDGKEYNWLVEFDRNGSFISGGDDCVTYMYKGGEWHAAIKAAGMESIAYGSYTDICYLQHLGVKAINMAIGYHDNHSPKAWFRPGEWMRSVDLFQAFYNANKDTRFAHEQVVETAVTRWTGYDSTSTDSTRYDSSGSQFIGYKTSKYQHGDVVMTSSTGRWDKRPQIGQIWNNSRGNFWTVIDVQGFVIDVITSNTHVVKHMKCSNCGMAVTNTWNQGPEWGLHNEAHVFCPDCWPVCQEYPDHVLDALVNSHTLTVDGDIIGTIEVLDEEGALMNYGGDIYLVDPEYMARSVRYAAQFDKDRLVVVNDIFLDLASVRYTYLVLDNKDDKVYIRRADADDGPTWIVPANIMTPVSVNEAEA